MARATFSPQHIAIIVGLLAAVIVSACSGSGGSSTPTPASPTSPPLGGIGASIAFTQHVNFTVLVPPPSTLSAIAAARRKRSAVATTTNPYVSPKTGSVTLQVGTVNGQSPRTLPAPTIVNISCSGNTGCSVPIQNVPAATGVDRFSVQTFSGPSGVGNLISSSFIDVTVPSAQATSFGGTGLTIGGYVQSISLALSIPGGGFFIDTAGTGQVDVNAIDPAGAIIIGSDQLANPIVVSLPNTNGTAFTINAAQQVTLQQPAQTLALAYDGASSLGGTLSASTTDENSNPIATSIPIPVSLPPTPTPVPVPSTKPALSLYVYDAASDRILEYAGVNAVEGGQPFSTTPRRAFDVAAPPALNANLINCQAGQGAPMLAGLAVGSDGTLYAQSYCTDAATSMNAYNFTYSAATQEAVPAGGTPTPPPPTSTIVIPNVGESGVAPNPQNLTLDQTHATILFSYAPSIIQTGSTGNGANIIGVPMNNPTAETTNFGAGCLQELARPTSCATDYSSAFMGSGFGFAVDATGHIYVPSQWQGYDANSNPVIPPGSPAQQFSSEPTVLLFSEGSMNPVPTPVSALSGFSDELGTAAPGGIAIEGTTLYVLTNPVSEITDPMNGNQVYPGLSGCPPPSSNATPDTVTSACVNPSGSATYIAGYSTAIAALTSPANAGTNVVNPPTFMVGGDIFAGFGNVSSTVGSYLAVQDGFAYVLNPFPANGSPLTEVDVYNLNNVTGFHTNIQPVTKLIFDASMVPTTIAVGPTGTGVGALALLRRPARVHHDMNAWRRTLQQMRRSRIHGRH